MLLKAAKEFNIDLSQSWMVGDSEDDVLAGRAAGCKTGLIGRESYGQDQSSTFLLDLIMTIVNK